MANELEQDQQLRERRGRAWRVHVAPHERGDGLTHALSALATNVRYVDERFADDYALVAETDAD